MVIKENIYINTDRDFYTDYSIGLELKCKIVFTHKVSKNIITVEQTITLPNTNNRYFIAPLDLSLFEDKGFYTYIIYLEKDGSYEEYERGLGLHEYVEGDDIYTDAGGDDNEIFVDND